MKLRSSLSVYALRTRRRKILRLMNESSGPRCMSATDPLKFDRYRKRLQKQTKQLIFSRLDT